MACAIKICGLSTRPTLEAALDAGADFVGFVNFQRSPRHVEPSAAGQLAAIARGRAKIVALVVDPSDVALDALIGSVAPDFVQLHGHETPARAGDIAKRWGVPVIKAVPVATSADADGAEAYRAAAAFPLFDAKPAPGAVLPGGNGVAFDWSVIGGAAGRGPFMLSGGLDAGNVARAIAVTGAPMVDVSSGVESAPGIKDIGKIIAFIAAVRGVTLHNAPQSITSATQLHIR